MENNSLSFFTAKVMLAELVIIVLFLLIRPVGELGVTITFSLIWLFITGFVNFAMLVMLLVYRPKFWLPLLLPLLLLPFAPQLFIMADFFYLMDSIMESLSKEQ
jgi:hypothetical protein